MLFLCLGGIKKMFGLRSVAVTCGQTNGSGGFGLMDTFCSATLRKGQQEKARNKKSEVNKKQNEASESVDRL
jgi:hypothetical protein